MNTEPRLEQRVTAAFNRAAATREPDGLLDSVLTTVGRTRTRPRWLAFIKEPPMRIHSRVAVGSPTFRLASIMALTLGLILALGAAVAVGASLLPTPVIVVAQDGSGTVRNITEAVAMAVDGDTILVKPGTYLESIAITKDITLRGDGDRAAVILDFAASGPTRFVEEQQWAYGILLEASSAHVGNLTLHGHPDGAGDNGLSAIIIDGGAPVIEQVDVILDGDPWPDYAFAWRSAFQIVGESTAVIRGSSWDGYTRILGSPTFEDNIVSAQRLTVWAGAPLIRTNTVLDGGSIVFGGADVGGIADGNHIIDGWIVIDEGAHPIVRENEVTQPHVPDAGTGDRGAAIQIGLGTPLIEGNTISDSPYGIELKLGAKPQITDNSILGSSGAAILVSVAADPAITGNVIERNTTGIEVVGTSTPILTNNKFCGNVTDLTVGEGSTLTLAGNTVCGVAVTAAP